MPQKTITARKAFFIFADGANPLSDLGTSTARLLSLIAPRVKKTQPRLIKHSRGFVCAESAEKVFSRVYVVSVSSRVSIILFIVQLTKLMRKMSTNEEKKHGRTPIHDGIKNIPSRSSRFPFLRLYTKRNNKHM